MSFPQDDTASDTSSEVETHNNLFVEPEGYFPPTPPPTTQTYTLLPTTTLPYSPSSSSSPTSSPNRTITLHLVGYSPTEAHHLWNGARVIAEYFEADPALVRGRTVLELGAAAGLPSLVAAVLGARRVVMTDYPDVEIVQTMWRNIDECGLLPRRRRNRKEENKTAALPSTTTTTTTTSNGSAAAAAAAAPSGDAASSPVPAPGSKQLRQNGDDNGGEEEEEDQDIILAKGYVWGADPTPLLACLPDDSSPSSPSTQTQTQATLTPTTTTTTPNKKFDVLILADLLFRHSEHGHLLDTVRDTLAPAGGKAFVFFTSYRPWLRHKDLAFFDLARERGFVVEKLLEKKMDRPMFEDDPGDEEVRKTCTGWVVRWPSEE